jgi:hypothetical protein
LRERLYSRVDKTSRCWTWTASTNEHGYGKIRVNGRTVKAHRVSYELEYGVLLTPAQKLLHECDNPPCVRPSHLFIGTQLDNMRDCVTKKRHAHGETSYSKLTEDQVRAIRADSRSQSKIAADYGVVQQTVFDIKHHKTWKHLA